MLIRIDLPTLGQGLHEAVVIEIKIGIGQQVSRGEELVLVESDKGVHSVAATEDGTVQSLLIESGQIVNAGDLLLSLTPSNPNMTPISEEAKETPSLENNFQIRQFVEMDFEEVWEIWQKNQLLASANYDENNQTIQKRDLRHSLLNTEGPFKVIVAEQRGQICGWASLLSCKNNPATKDLVAEVTLYVTSPESSINPAMLLIWRILQLASEARMSFLIGFTGQDNTRANKMLKSAGFRILGPAGTGTLVWCFDCPKGKPERR